MQDVLMPSLALAAAHAGDLDTLQAFVELVSPPTPRVGHCSHGCNTPRVLTLRATLGSGIT